MKIVGEKYAYTLLIENWQKLKLAFKYSEKMTCRLYKCLNETVDQNEKHNQINYSRLATMVGFTKL